MTISRKAAPVAISDTTWSPLLRQSIYGRLAGFYGANDAESLAQDPAMRVVVGWQGSDRNAAGTSEMGRFETEALTAKDNLAGLPRFLTSGGWMGAMRAAHIGSD